MVSITLAFVTNCSLAHFANKLLICGTDEKFARIVIAIQVQSRQINPICTHAKDFFKGQVLSRNIDTTHRQFSLGVPRLNPHASRIGCTKATGRRWTTTLNQCFSLNNPESPQNHPTSPELPLHNCHYNSSTLKQNTKVLILQPLQPSSDSSANWSTTLFLRSTSRLQQPCRLVTSSCWALKLC